MSELKVNTISEVTGANGVVIDSTKLKDGGVIIADAGNIGSASDTDALSISSGGVVTFTQKPVINSGVAIDNITIDGTEIDLSSGDLTIDVAGDIILDADGADLKFQDGGTDILSITNNSTDVDITVATQDKDINFKGDDGGSGITALSLDMSDAGTAVFNHDIRIADGGQIGSASDADAIAIASNGVVTFSQAATFSSTIGSSGAITATVSGTGLKSVGTNAQVSADASSGYAALITDGAASQSSHIFFQTDGTDKARVTADSSGNFTLASGGTTEGMRIDSNQKLSTGGETGPDVDAGGITIDINANDNKFLTLKSSDYSHGITDHLETDTTFAIAKSQSGGGVSMTVCNDGANENVWNLTSIMGEANTTATNTTAGGNFTFGVYRKADSGTGTQAVADAGNAWVMRNNNAARLIFKGDGEIHSDTGSTTYDAYEDAQLVRAFDLSHGVGVINSKFDKFISYNHEKLADLGLVGRDENGTPNHFTNITGMQKLHNGAIWQQYTKHNQLLEAVYELATESVGKEKADAILEKHEIKLLN